jgi:hypothetical protein
MNKLFLRTSFEYIDNKNTRGKGFRNKESIIQVGFSYGLN